MVVKYITAWNKCYSLKIILYLILPCLIVSNSDPSVHFDVIVKLTVLGNSDRLISFAVFLCLQAFELYYLFLTSICKKCLNMHLQVIFILLHPIRIMRHLHHFIGG